MSMVEQRQSYFLKLLISVLLDAYPDVGVLDCVVVLIFWGIPIPFSIVAAPPPLIFPPSAWEDPMFSTSSATLLPPLPPTSSPSSSSPVMASPTGVSWYPTVVLICISPTMSNDEIVSRTCWCYSSNQLSCEWPFPVLQACPKVSVHSHENIFAHRLTYPSACSSHHFVS